MSSQDSEPYRSCRYLQRGLNLKYEKITCCAILHHGTGEPRLVDKYRGGSLPLATISQRRRELIELVRRGTLPACEGCQFLETRLWPESDDRVHWLGITSWMMCNLACEYCELEWLGTSQNIRDGRMVPAYYDVRDCVAPLIAADRLTQDAVIDWGGGGEPTLIPGFDGMLRALDSRGAVQWLHTNGLRLPRPIRDREIDSGRVHVLCSLDAGSAETYKVLKGKDRYWRVWRNLAAYAEAGVEVTAKYIVCEPNADERELEGFVLDAAQHGRPAIIGDIDYRYPDPSETVLMALVHLQRFAVDAGLHFEFAGLGTNQRPELRIGERVSVLAGCTLIEKPRRSRRLPSDRRPPDWRTALLGLIVATAALGWVKTVRRRPRRRRSPHRWSLLTWLPANLRKMLGRVAEPVTRLKRRLRVVIRRRLRPLLRALRLLAAARLGQLRQHRPVPFVPPTRDPKASTVDARLPSIAIVTPARNAADFLPRTVDSVLSQHYPALHYRIQDGASTDDSAAFLARAAARGVQIVSQPDASQTDALNNAFESVPGEIMAWLNANDLLLPNSLQYVGRYFAKHPEVDVIYGHRVLIDEQDYEIGRWILPPHDRVALRWADYVPSESLFWRRRVWEQVGARLDESYRFAMDWELLLRFHHAGAMIVRLPRFLGAFRVHQDQKSSEVLSTVGAWEMGRLRQREHGRPVSTEEAGRAVTGYLMRALILHYWWQLGFLRA